MSEDLCSTLCTAPLVDITFPFTRTSCEAEKPLLPLEITESKALQVHVESQGTPQKLRKTCIDIFGICCPAEVPLVKKILQPLPGVQEVLVNVAARTVTVRHDAALTSAAWLVKLLNDAKLEASIHEQGEWKAAHKWPNPYTIASGLMVAITFFQYAYSPLRWVGLGAVAVGIPPILMRSFIALQRCLLDINVLMLIAVAGAISLGDYLEAGSIVFLFTLADWLESRSSDKARMAISSVANLAPQVAFLADNGLKVPVAEVAVGSRLSVKSGDQVPIDGLVVFGKSAVDESSLTGESMLVDKEAGATVWAGTLNITGYLCIQTTALAEESAVSRMVRLVEEAQTQRSNVEQLVEKFAKYYTPVVVILATAIAIVPLSMHAHNVRHWLYVALVLLVVACPCALVISTPVTTTCAIARAARMGLIVKSGSSLEALGKLKVIALDKTGTLTEGHFQVSEVRALSQNTELPKLLYWIACIESQSSHPMASSLVAYAKLHGIKPSGVVKDFTVLAGEGVSGLIDGHIVHIGNERLAKRLHWAQAETAEPALLESWRSQGWTVSWIGLDGNLEGILCAGDPLRSEAQEAVCDMKKLGLQLVMLTGDSLAAANVAQKKLGEIEVHAQLLPQDKVEMLREIKSRMGCTGMVGDGINDAPALATADVGIAMGVAGSAVAMETADIALMTNDLRKLAAAVKLGRKARWKIRQNIALSLATKLLIIALAGFGYASLWGAVLADVGTCLIVIFNSMLLLGRGNHRHHRHGHHGHQHHYHSCNDGNEHGGHDAHHHGHHSSNDGSKHDFHDTYGHKDHHHCHHGHHHRKTSCQGQGSSYHLKLKLPSILNCACMTRKHGGHDGGCCNHHADSWSVAKGSCNCASNNDAQWRLADKNTCAKDFQGIDYSSTAMARISDCLTDTACHCTTETPNHFPAAGGEDKKHYEHDQELNLCAAYCAYEATADELLCASYCGSLQSSSHSTR